MNADGFLTLPPRLRAALFQQAFDAQAGESAVPSLVIIEKDFWVCWLLHQLFQPDPLVEGLVFKGGTSLSKAYNAIQRFSEDVDLTVPTGVAIKGLAIHDSTPERERRSIAQQMQAQVRQWCQNTFRPALASRIEVALRNTPVAQEWSLDCNAAKPDELLFRFPASLDQGEYDAAAEVRRVVLLELGARNPTVPAEEKRVSPICSPIVDEYVTDCLVPVTVLQGKRTFWEKVTILHELNRRPPGRTRPKNYSRHLSDVAVLCAHEIGQEALKDLPLLRTVAMDKHRMFYDEYANYPAAARGEIAIVPSESEMPLLKKDYEALSELAYTGTRLSFEEAVERVRKLEADIRGRAYEIADD